MSRGDGRNPKFRLLCKCCNSYQHTNMKIMVVMANENPSVATGLFCTKCNNLAQNLNEEFESDAEPYVPAPIYRR